MVSDYLKIENFILGDRNVLELYGVMVIEHWKNTK